MKSSIQLLVADSSEVFIEGIRSWVSGIVNIEIAGIFRSWDELCLFLNGREDNVIIVTQCKWLQKTDILNIQQFLNDNENTRIVTFCSSKKRKQILNLVESGVSGFFNPGTGHEEFILGLIDVAHGQVFVSKGLRMVFSSLPSFPTATSSPNEANNILYTGN